jgi:hypothetical protein
VADLLLNGIDIDRFNRSRFSDLLGAAHWYCQRIYRLGEAAHEHYAVG